MPRLEGRDGVNKMSKSLDNYVGIDEPPGEIFGKLMSISDELMRRYIELLSFESLDTMAAWKLEVEQGRNPRDIKAGFAREIVARFHSQEAARHAEAEFQARFREGAMPEDMPEVALATAGHPMAIAQILKASGLTASTSEALRMIEQGGVRIDGERVADKALRVDPRRAIVLQVGKRKFARVTLT